MTTAKERADSAQEQPVSNVPVSPAYTKEQYLQSDRYAERKDVLSVLLADDKTYTHDEVQALMDAFMKKEAR